MFEFFFNIKVLGCYGLCFSTLLPVGVLRNICFLCSQHVIYSPGPVVRLDCPLSSLCFLVFCFCLYAEQFPTSFFISVKQRVVAQLIIKIQLAQMISLAYIFTVVGNHDIFFINLNKYF